MIFVTVGSIHFPFARLVDAAGRLEGEVVVQHGSAPPPPGDSLGRRGSGASSGSGAVASAPTTRGAAAPQRAWRDARAADTSGESAAMGPTIEQMF